MDTFNGWTEAMDAIRVENARMDEEYIKILGEPDRVVKTDSEDFGAWLILGQEPKVMYTPLKNGKPILSRSVFYNVEFIDLLHSVCHQNKNGG